MDLSVQQVAKKQLESAIFMYAYDFDEIAVHTVSASAFELLTERLKQGTIISGLDTDLRKKYIRALKTPNNFFKHGQINYKNVDYIKYEPTSLDHLIMLACQANISGPTDHRMQCSFLYMLHYSYKHRDVLSGEYIITIQKVLEKQDSLEALGDMSKKKTLQKYLNLITNWRMPSYEK